MAIDLIYDRVLADVNSNTDKGFYNSSDLNRVGLALTTLRDMLTDCGYIVNITPKTDWTPQEIPTLQQMQTYLANVSAIREALTMPPGAPEVPGTMNNLNWQGANDIERILGMVEAHIDRMMRTIDLGWAMGIAHTGLFGGI